MNNSSRIISILKRWPPDENKKTRDFGIYLREMVKNNFGNGSSAGENQEIINQKLDALERLCKNEHGNKYSSNYKIGATGLPLKDLKMILTDDYISKHNKRKWFKWK